MYVCMYVCLHCNPASDCHIAINHHHHQYVCYITEFYSIIFDKVVEYILVCHLPEQVQKETLAVWKMQVCNSQILGQFEFLNLYRLVLRC